MKDDHKTKKQLIDELTELRSQNVELKKSESSDKYRSLVENIREVIYELDDQGVILYISPAVRDILGFDSDEIVGKSFIELAHKDDQRSLSEWFYELRKGVESPTEYRVSNKSCELRWARTKSRPFVEDNLFKGARGILIDITSQKLIEEALIESEEKYRELVQYAPAGIYEVDYETGRFKSVNDVICEYTGYTKDELLNINLYNLLTEESQKLMSERLEKLSAGEKMPQTVEYCIITKGGEKLWVLLNVRYIYEEGKLKGATGVIYNINERKQVEETLRESGKRFRELAELLPETVFEADVQGILTFVNRIAFDRFGYTQEDFASGLNLLNMVTPDDCGRALENSKKIMNGENIGPNEYTMLRKDGSTFPAIIHSTFIIHDGKPAGLRGFIVDITERKRTEKALLESKILLDAIQQMTKIGGWEWDVVQQTMTWTDETYRIHGLVPGEIIPGSPEHIRRSLACYNLDDRPVIEAAFRRCVEQGQPYDMELPFNSIDGCRLWIRTVARPVFEGKHVAKVIGNIMDITDRRKTEIALQESEEKYRLTFNTSPDSVNINRLEDGLYVDINDGFAKLTGFTREEVIGRTSLEINIWNDPADRQKLIQGLQNYGYYENLEASFRRKDGSVGTGLMSARIIPLNGVPHIISITRDITERKLMEEALRESENKYRDLSIIDDLTQLYNSRYFHQQLRMEIDRVNRYGQPLTLLLLDLDDFKKFNDSYGHVEGDHVLSRLGQVVKRWLRQTDSAYRYGGEEFTIMLPMTSSADGAITAERIRIEFKKENFVPESGEKVHMTLSIGLAQYKPQEDMKAFVHRVDQLMYQGKKNGKDRVCCES